MAQLNSLKPIYIAAHEITVYVRMKWKLYRQVAAEIEAADGTDVAEVADRFLRQIVQDIKGLTDDQGEPLKWSADLLDEMDPQLVLDIVGAIMNVGEAAEGPLPQEPPATETS